MNYLLLTLGHGSSAIYVECSDDNHVTRKIGYEQERLSGIKSDSQFPIDAITEIFKHVSLSNMQKIGIYISHWFDDEIGDFAAFKPSKYMEHEHLKWLTTMFSPTFIKFTNKSFTHHDAHAYSALGFFNDSIKEEQKSKAPLHVIVADGFGTNKEVISVYTGRCDGSNELKLEDRIHGYESSLGLMYQYATSFVGMKENQDEYKFLGYESHVDEEFESIELDMLNDCVINCVNCLLHFDNSSYKHRNIIDFKALKDCKRNWFNTFKSYLDLLTICDRSEYKARVAIAYIIQQTVEHYVGTLISKFGMHNVVVVGGCFYNVKLNNFILNHIDGLFCAMPLAGDQGAALGMLEADGIHIPYKTLCIGTRNFYNANKIIANHKYSHLITFADGHFGDYSDYDCLAECIAQDIANGEMVNIVTNRMEFGPRALLSTSTLFLPTKENAEKNNRMNGRNEVMPFAPVCLEEELTNLFFKHEYKRVVGSLNFMICTLEYNKQYSLSYAGVMHKKPLEFAYTGRPQVVKESSFEGKILEHVRNLSDAKCIVNTSFNVHGQPIVFNLSQILNNFEYQCRNCEANNEKLPKMYIIA